MLQEKMPSKQITDYLLDNWCTDKWGCQWANYGRHLFYEDQDTNNLVERLLIHFITIHLIYYKIEILSII